MNDVYVPDKGFVQMFFRYDNRINRRRYFLRGMLIGIIAMIIAAICLIPMLTAYNDALYNPYADPYANPFDALSIPMLLITALISLTAGTSSIMLMIRRLHDLGKSGWFVLLIFVPIIQGFLGIYLLFFKGTDGANQYGADPLSID